MSDPGVMVSPSGPPPCRWQPLGGIDRRVLGVLAEKAKTTPDIYPMSLNAICTGGNQKSNRDPLMQLEPDQVEESLDRLREIGAVGLVEGYGRVQKFRHYLYEWLGVDKIELAVMAELLLRGDQTTGELRGRASRMEPISDLAALRPILDSLKSKGLVITLSPEGRGQVVTHALYKPREFDALRAKYEGAGTADMTPKDKPVPASIPTGDSMRDSGDSDHGALSAMKRDLDELRNQTTQLRSDLDAMCEAHDRVSEEVRALKEALGG